MTIGTVKRLAADMMGVGVNRIRILPDRFKEADKALTRADVRNLIKSGIVKKVPVQGRRKKNLSSDRGHGSRKGTAKTRRGSKDVWMAKVRSQRSMLRQVLDEGALDPTHKRKIYNRVKSGLFRSKRAFITYLKEAGMLKVDYEPAKRVFVKKENTKPVASATVKSKSTTEVKKS